MSAAGRNVGREPLADLVGDLRQLASVRRVELADGPERGVRALVFSTGGGLDFWVLQDRSMDIGTLAWRGVPVAWLHPGGFAHPGLGDPARDGGRGIERSLGGFLVTCGLDNVRQPRDGRPLHGTLPFTPARLIASGEDWAAPTPVLYAEAEMVSARLHGASFRLVRRIEAEIGRTRLTVSDTVENIGPEPAEMMILYHVNLGFPAVGRGTAVALDGRPIPFRDTVSDAAPPAAVTYPTGDGDGDFAVSVVRPPTGDWPGFRMEILGARQRLPHVQFWQDWRRRRNIFSIEPVNCDRNADGTSGPGTLLAPGERWTSTLRIGFAQPTV
jgi:hypothetical protein